MTKEQRIILIVDDDTDMLWVLSNLFEHAGYGVMTAQNAQEALTCLQQQDFALAFIDVKLPDKDGLELARLVKERYPALPTVMLSGYYYSEDPEIAQGLNRQLYAGFIAKPFDLKEVRNIVQNTLEHRA